MSQIAVVARIPAQSGKRAELEAALQLALDSVEQEPGTRLYTLHRDLADADVLWMYELYDAQADLDAHAGSEWFKELGPVIRPFLAGRPELTLMTPVGGKGL
jgi:quinol monooxygenase YgiN